MANGSAPNFIQIPLDKSGNRYEVYRIDWTDQKPQAEDLKVYVASMVGIDPGQWAEGKVSIARMSKYMGPTRRLKIKGKKAVEPQPGATSKVTDIMFVSPSGKPLNLCSVKVCKKRIDFHVDGIALKTIDEFSVMRSATPHKNGTIPRAARWTPYTPNIPNKDGYCITWDPSRGGEVLHSDTRDSKCPTKNGVQQICVQTYEPGRDVCECGSCSAFSGKQKCDEGDLTVSSYGCCFTCPDQPICGKCADGCDPKIKSVEVIPGGNIPKAPTEVTVTQGISKGRTEMINKTPTQTKATRTFTFTYQLSGSIKYASKTAESYKAKLSFGVPFTDAKGELEYGASKEWSTENTVTETQTSAQAYSQEITAMPYTTQVVTAETVVSTIKVRIPVIVRTTYTCKGPGMEKDYEEEESTADITVDGVALMSSDKWNLVYETPIPIDPEIVYPPADATCASNPICSKQGLREGNCCPNDEGRYLDCCSFCSIRPGCQNYAQNPTTMCCPTQTDIQYDCCKEPVTQNSPPPPPSSPPPPPDMSPPPPGPPASCAKGDAICNCNQLGQGLWADIQSKCKYYYECYSTTSTYQKCGIGFKFSQSSQTCQLSTLVNCNGVVGELDEEDINALEDSQ